MAPKKSVLLLITLSLALGLATAQQSSNELTVPQEEVWLNEEGAQVGINASFSSECVPDSGEVTVITPSGESVGTESGDHNDYLFSNFGNEGKYTIEASCEHETDSETVEDGTDTFEAYELGISEVELSYAENNRDNIAYVGEEVKVSFDVTPSEINVPELGKDDFNYNLEGLEGYELNEEGDILEDSFENQNGEISFSFKASESMEGVESLAVSPKGFDIQDSATLDIQPVWQVNDVSVSTNQVITDNTVKYRRIDDLKLSFGVTKEGESVDSLSDSDFEIDGDGFGDGVGWFKKDDYSNSEYSISLRQNPDIGQGEASEVNVYVTQDNIGDLDRDLEVVEDLRIERDVVFSGAVLDVGNKGVDTDFVADYMDPGNEDFSTDENGNFKNFLVASKLEDGSRLRNMLIEFRNGQASLSLDGMEVDKEDPGDISYQYYDNVEEKTEVNLDQESLDGVRPVNLASFVSNYNFDSDSRNTWAKMVYDTSDIRPQEIEVYECNQWTFRAEECADNWEKIDNEQVSLKSGATWKAEFPITPLESDRFEDNEGVLLNAYLVGVPQGVGSGLNLDSQLDVSNSRVASGKELSVSGRIIDDTTGESVEGVNVGLDLVSEEDDVSESTSTDENGNFEFTTSIEEAGNYDVELSASKSPYESFEQSQSDAIEVYYETGLTIESDSNPEIGLGEDYNIEYDIENVGQASVNDIELSVSGVDNGETSLSPTSISSLEPGSSQTVVLTVNLDEDLRTPPSITFEAEGTSADKTVTQTSSTLVSLADDATTSNQEDSQETQESQQDSQETDSSGSMPNPSEIQQVTGEFIESQSQMNLALGLILVFAAILAVAVKNKDGDSRDMRGRGQGRGQSRVQAPQVAPQEEEEPESGQSEASEKEESSDSSEGSEESSDEESDSVECDVCGETFDTESGMNLHKQALH